MGERLPYGFHYGFMFPVADSFFLNNIHLLGTINQNRRFKEISFSIVDNKKVDGFISIIANGKYEKA